MYSTVLSTEGKLKVGFEAEDTVLYCITNPGLNQLYVAMRHSSVALFRPRGQLSRSTI